MIQAHCRTKWIREVAQMMPDRTEIACGSAMFYVLILARDTVAVVRTMQGMKVFLDFWVTMELVGGDAVRIA